MNSSLIILITFVIAGIAIYFLYSIVLFQGLKNKGDTLQLSSENILEQVEILYNKKEFQLVELLASKYLDRVPGHIEVRKYLAKAYYANKKYNQAIHQCVFIIRKNHKEYEVIELLGDCFIKNGRLDKAIEQYTELFEAKRTSKKVLRTLGELYKETEQYFSAIEMYTALVKVLENNEDIADVQGIIAELNEEVRNYHAAFDAYKARLNVYPQDIATNKKVVELYIKIKNYQMAKETLNYMLTLTTEPTLLQWIYENLVDIDVQNEDYESAILNAENLLELPKVEKFKVRTQIASFCINLNRLAEGIEILEDLAIVSQHDFNITTELCKTYIKCREYEKARAKYNILLDKSSPQEAKSVNLLMCDLYITWAIEKIDHGENNVAFELLNTAMQYNVINPEIYYYIAYNNNILANYSAAIDSLKQALEYNKDNERTVKYLLLLASIHHSLGNVFEEKKALNDLLKIDGENPEGLYRMGLMFESQRDVKNAEEYFLKAIELDDNLIDAKYSLGLLYEGSDKAKAKSLYIEILEQDPTYVVARDSLNEINAVDSFDF